MSPLKVGAKQANTAWGFTCTVTFPNGDAFTISNGKDAASSNAAGNTFNFSTDATATFNGNRRAASKKAETLTLSIVEDFSTAAGLLPAAFNGTVELTGNCKKSGAKNSSDVAFTANNVKLESSTGDCPGGGGAFDGGDNSFTKINIAPFKTAGNVVRISETLNFIFQAGAAVNSSIADTGTVTLTTTPEPDSVELALSGLLIGIAAAGRKLRHRARRDQGRNAGSSSLA